MLSPTVHQRASNVRQAEAAVAAEIITGSLQKIGPSAPVKALPDETASGT